MRLVPFPTGNAHQARFLSRSDESMTEMLTREKQAHLVAIGKLGGSTWKATNDTKAFSAQGNRTFRDSFLNGHKCTVCRKPIVIPADLPEEERLRRAQAAYELHFRRLNFWRHHGKRSR